MTEQLDINGEGVYGENENETDTLNFFIKVRMITHSNMHDRNRFLKL